MSKKQDLKQYLKQLEKEVSKVYYHITNGIISKPYTISNEVIHVAEEQTNKFIAEETNALRARIAELERALDVDVDLTIAGLRAELSDALTRIAELEAERKRLFEDKSRLMDCYFEFETIAPDGELKISVLDLYNELTDTRARAERAEAMVTRLIEAGNILADGLDTYWQECYPQALGFWNSLVTEWKERQ